MNRLEQEVARLTTAMAHWQPSSSWRTIRFADAVDVRYTPHSVQIPQLALCAPEVYADRFEDHLRAGYSWINLNAVGVVDGVLIVLVELPHRPSGASYDRVAVNLSGPSAGVGVELAAAR
jgi:hypothetical protein